MQLSHAPFEKNVFLLIVGVLITVSIGGLVQLVPLFTMEQTIEKAEGMRPYSPLELAGRNIYVREGCYLCHSQMIRPFRDEAERYGHYSLAAESMYDHPFQWGSKRTGPDLARVGGKYSNDWHVAHLTDPRSVVPESVMPTYGFLAHKELKFDDVAEHMKTLRIVGVPYTDEEIADAKKDLAAQANGESGDTDGLLKRYPKAVVGDFDGDPSRVTEMDAVVAYLQMLGTLVDFKDYHPETDFR
ncbi:MAG: cytochrome-c oxidase, cbb3-type subunit II [Rhodospirillales bacterium]|nr:cytochrome-c oxidase, cbb3-type subunit II [Rhodospirillales bacterium]